MNTKPTQRYAQPRWPIIRLAFPMSGDENFAEPTRQQIESSTDATLLDWLLEDVMVLSVVVALILLMSISRGEKR